MRRQLVGGNPLALEQLPPTPGTVDRQLQVSRQILNGVAPSVGGYGIQGQSGGQDKQSPAQQDAFPLRPALGIKQVQPAQRDNGENQQRPHNSQIGQNPHRQAQQNKGGRRIPAKGPLQQIQGNHKHTEKYRVFGIKERVGVDAGMQQKNQQGQEGNKAVVEQPISQQIAKEAAEDKEQVGEG